MKKRIALTIAMLAVVTSAFAFDDVIWCKVDYANAIKGCFPTFRDCEYSSHFGDCKPYKNR
jgi:dsDNA-specific endonuclease/ATPase MutS2